MKTTLIQIDPHDDLTSIKDKMTWSKSARMLLFFPSGYPLFQTDLVLRLIQRYSVNLGSQLAIVTRDSILKNIAEGMGIPCFSSAPQAEKRLWKVRESSNLVRLPKGAEAIQEQKNSLPVTRLKASPTNFQKVFTSVLLITLLIALAWFFIPSAKIVINPVSEIQDISYKVSADTDFLLVDISGRLPAEKLSQDISATLTKKSTETILLPIEKASGFVNIINISSQEIIIPVGSALVSDTEPKRFYLLVEDVNLQPDNSEPLSVEIEAVEPGDIGNIPPDVVFFIEGYEDLIQVQNPIAISGGVTQSLPSPGEADYLYLQNKLITQLQESCEETMNSQVQSDHYVIPGSVLLDGEVQLVEAPLVGQPSDSASLAITIECTALIIDKKDEIELATRILDQNLLSGTIPLNGDILVTAISKVKVEGGDRFSWMVNVSRQITQKWDSEKLIGSLLGKSVPVAKEILAAGPPQNSPALITLNPPWWGNMPLLPIRVHIEVSGE
jgi:hypothetical protein